MENEDDPKPDGLWKPFTKTYDINNRMHVVEVPRYRGEWYENYCTRVAYVYTMQAGLDYRNERLTQHWHEGKTLPELAVMYGLSKVATRKCLQRLDLIEKRPPAKEITPDLIEQIIKMRTAGATYASIKKETGITYERVVKLMRTLRWKHQERLMKQRSKAQNA
jgi:hypothetical protein